MVDLTIITDYLGFVPVLRTIITIVVTIIIFNYIISIVKKTLLKKAKTKKQISNVEIFTRLMKYGFFVLIIFFGFLSYAGSWTGIGVSIGLFSAALGWALQKPISGIAAWLMIILKRPFELGDRIIIGNVRGDVADITLTHVYLKEIGGIIGGEENSGRIVMVPNSTLFEQNIINYTHQQEEHMLDQVAFTVTFGSDLDKAIQIAIGAATKHTKDVISATGKKPYIRTYIKDNGMSVNVRYMANAKRLQELSSTISKELFDSIRKTKKVELAYPHREIIIKKK